MLGEQEMLQIRVQRDRHTKDEDLRPRFGSNSFVEIAPAKLDG